METMASHLHKVTFKEQLIICHVIREYSDELKYAHLSPALLPFVPMRDVQSALQAKRTSRPVAVIHSKLKTIEAHYLGRVWLLDRKVAKVFGAAPEKGRHFKWLPPTCDRGKPIDPLVALRFVRKNTNTTQQGGSVFDVVVHPAYRQPVLAWLVDNCT